MSPTSDAISRRHFFRAGGAGALGLAGLSMGCTPERPVTPTASLRASRDAAGAGPDDLSDTPRVEPVDGLTHATLVAATDPVVLGGRRALEPVAYNGLPCGPTLVARLGGTLDVLLVNRIAHTQGGVPYAPPSGGAPAGHVTAGGHRHRHGLHAMAGMAATSGDPQAGATTNLHFPPPSASAPASRRSGRSPTRPRPRGTSSRWTGTRST